MSRLTILDVRRALRRWGWRDWLVLAALAFVVAASWLPWFGESDGGEHWRLSADASAWTASTQWTIAVALTLVAGSGWLVARLVGRLETAAGVAALALVAVSIWLTVHRWHSIPNLEPGQYKVTTILTFGDAKPPGVRPYAVYRDELSIDHSLGHWSDVRFGLYLGLLAMGLLAVMLLAALATHRARAEVGEAG